MYILGRGKETKRQTDRDASNFGFLDCKCLGNYQVKTEERRRKMTVIVMDSKWHFKA